MTKPETENEFYSCNKCQATFKNLKDLKIHDQTPCLDLVSTFSYGYHFMSAFFPEISENVQEAIESAKSMDSIDAVESFDEKTSGDRSKYFTKFSYKRAQKVLKFLLFTQGRVYGSQNKARTKYFFLLS